MAPDISAHAAIAASPPVRLRLTLIRKVSGRRPAWQRSEDTRRRPRKAALDLEKPDSAVCCVSGVSAVLLSCHVLSARRGRTARTPFGSEVWALPVVVAAIKCGVCCPSLVGPCVCWWVGGTRDVPVEALFPEGWERFELGSSGWSRVLGIEAVGGAPYCDFADEGGAGVASRCSPGWRGGTLAGVVLDVGGEVGDLLGSLGQVGPPDGMIMQR